MRQILFHVILGLEYFFYAHVFLTFFSYLAIVLSQRGRLVNLKSKSISADGDFFQKFHPPKISFILPAFNEEKNLCETIDSIAAINYPNYELLIINDGSIDKTLERLVNKYQFASSGREKSPRKLGLFEVGNIYESISNPNLYLIDKVHSGKPDTINSGIDQSVGVFICCIDADTLILPNGIDRLVARFINEPKLLALGGAVAPSNGMHLANASIYKEKRALRFIEKIQVIEYLRSFTAWRNALSYLGGTLLISGALTIFRKSALVEVGGYVDSSQSEDLEIILRMHRFYLEKKIPYYIWNVEDVVCWTRVPDNAFDLRRQRIRWMRGALESISLSRSLLFSSQNRFLGWVAFPHLIFIEAIAPIIEFAGLICIGLGVYLGILSFEALVIYGLLAYALAGFYAWYAIYVNDSFFRNYESLIDVLKLGLIGLIEPLGYRQRDAWWRLIAWYQWITGHQKKW
jgi:cellulose synthase/poly-beta-1,6-N-acetylglucosamine synthase-like glycosyltransferase